MLWGGAIITLTFLFVAMIPVIGPIIVIMTPLPVLYYYSSLGRIQGSLVLAASLLMAYMILGHTGQGANLPVLVMIGFTGIVLSEILKRHLSIEKTFLLSALVLFGCSVAFVFYHAYRTGIAPWQVLGLYVEAIVRENIKLYGQLNIAEDQIHMIRESVPHLTHFFTGIFPSLALSGIVFTIWLNLLAGRRLFWKNGLAFPDFGDLAAWKTPERLVWVLIVAGGMVILPGEGITIVGINLLILCGTLYLFHGLAIVSFFFRQKRVPVMLRWLFYGLLLIQQYMLIIVIACGLFDMWVDFRKRIGGIKDAPA
jgi:uncharacterized protein YybS (DUF2232 family)